MKWWAILIIFLMPLTAATIIGSPLEPFDDGGVIGRPFVGINFSVVNVSDAMTLQGFLPADLPVSTPTQTELNLKVPYTGATNNTDLGFFNLSLKGRLGVGTSNPLFKFHGVEESGTFFNVLDGYGVNENNTGGSIIGRGARGTAASPSATRNNDILMFMGGRGYGTTGFSALSRGVIAIRASEDWTDTAQGAHIRFFTTPIGQTANVEKLRLTDIGRLGIGTTTPNSQLQVTGSISLPIMTLTTTTTLGDTVSTVLVNNAGVITINLPTAVGIEGRIYRIKKISVTALNNVIIDPFGAQTIDGSLTTTLTTIYQSVSMQSNGANWFII